MAKQIMEEEREKFAEIVIGMADLFKRDPAGLYESLIQNYWDILANRMTIEEFEEATMELKRTMYTMPVPRQVLDQVSRIRGLEVSEEVDDPELRHDEMVLYEGRNLIALLPEEERAKLFARAERAVKLSFGEFFKTINEQTKRQSIEVKAAQMIWSKEHRGKDK